MSRLGRSQPVPPYVSQQLPAGDPLPPRAIIVDRVDQRHRYQPLAPVILSGSTRAFGQIQPITPTTGITEPMVVSGTLNKLADITGSATMPMLVGGTVGKAGVVTPSGDFPFVLFFGGSLS